ncbi:MAG: DUF362 domain-containing protein, partial [Phycisphaerae bacterium]
MRAGSETSRRQFLVQAGAGAIALAAGGRAGRGLTGKGRPAPAKARVVIARDEALTERLAKQVPLMVRMLGAAVQRLTGRPTAAQAWASIFSPSDVVGIKVNCLGLATNPAVVQAIVGCLRQASVPAEQIIIWDRFDVELAAAGYKLNRSASGVRCYGTDASGYGSGYERRVETSGRVASCFSRIVAQQCTALISAAVLKDHNLAGVSLSLKNFFGAIHNPNKYHLNNCDPYIADVVAHRYIRPKLRLAVVDATCGQYEGGPARQPGFAWP